MYKPTKLVTQKTFREVAPPNISPPERSYLEIALKYKVKQSKNGKSILKRKLPPVLKLGFSTLC